MTNEEIEKIKIGDKIKCYEGDYDYIVTYVGKRYVLALWGNHEVSLFEGDLRQSKYYVDDEGEIIHRINLIIEDDSLSTEVKDQFRFLLNCELKRRQNNEH